MSAHGERHEPPARGDPLLRAIDELRELEREKRQLPTSSPPFRDLAHRVEAKAREVFRIARDSDADADAENGNGEISSRH